MSFCNSIESHLKYTCTCNIFADVESSTSCWWCGFTIVCSSTDVLTSDEAVSLLKERSKGKHERGETKNWNVLNRMRRAKQIYWPRTISDVITFKFEKIYIAHCRTRSCDTWLSGLHDVSRLDGLQRRENTTSDQSYLYLPTTSVTLLRLLFDDCNTDVTD